MNTTISLLLQPLLVAARVQLARYQSLITWLLCGCLAVAFCIKPNLQLDYLASPNMLRSHRSYLRHPKKASTIITFIAMILTWKKISLKRKLLKNRRTHERGEWLINKAYFTSASACLSALMPPSLLTAVSDTKSPFLLAAIILV
jgi:hypothetical protein